MGVCIDVGVTWEGGMRVHVRGGGEGCAQVHVIVHEGGGCGDVGEGGMWVFGSAVVVTVFFF